MTQFDAEVSENRELTKEYFEIVFRWPEKLRVPLPGQFLSLITDRSVAPFLPRPFALSSFSRAEQTAGIVYQVRGSATERLTLKKTGDFLDCVGPRGFPFSTGNAKRPLLVGGGVGIGPLVFAANWLAEKDYKPRLILGYPTASSVPDLTLLPSVELQICTEDGTYGFRGRPVEYLESIEPNERQDGFVWSFDTRSNLKNVHLWATQVDLPCQVCWDEVIACGVGACQGCVVATTDGRQMVRACTGGTRFRFGEYRMDLSLTLRGTRFPGPVGVASGTFGYAKEYEALVDFSKIATIYTKAVTPEPRVGNPAPRLVETAAGMLNSIGLANVGLEAFIRDKMPFLRKIPSKIIVNVAGATDADYEAVVEALELVSGIDGYEINVSCPNVKHGGMGLGTDPKLVAAMTRSLRTRTERPLIIKLSPNVTDIASIAKAAEAEGADAVSCINTLLGMVIDLRTKKPVLPSGTGGLSGAAVLPVAIAAVSKVSRSVSIPVIGIGGITRWEDAVQHLLAGASLIQVGSGTFANPKLAQEVADGIESWARDEGIVSMEQLHALAK